MLGEFQLLLFTVVCPPHTSPPHTPHPHLLSCCSICRKDWTAPLVWFLSCCCWTSLILLILLNELISFQWARLGVPWNMRAVLCRALGFQTGLSRKLMSRSPDHLGIIGSSSRDLGRTISWGSCRLWEWSPRSPLLSLDYSFPCMFPSLVSVLTVKRTPVCSSFRNTP